MRIFVNQIAELVSFSIAIYAYPYLKNNFMKWFMPFLGLILLGEIIASYFFTTSNVKIYYIISMSEVFFYGYVFYSLSHRFFLKKFIVFFIFFSEAGYIVTFFLYGEDNNYLLMNLIISGFFLVIISLGYLFTKIVDDDEILLVKEPGFWIAMGVLLFFSGASISFSLYEMIKAKSLLLWGRKLYNLIPEVLSIVLYMCISIAIILCKQKMKV